MRKEFTGRLCVFRDHGRRETLSATVRLIDGTELYYYKAPKCFDDVVTPLDNVKDIIFTANPDGSNPRNVCVTKVG